MSRPTKYSKSLANHICDLVATHPYGLAKLCNLNKDIPVKSTIFLWKRNNKEFSDQYAQAKREQANLLAEECLDMYQDTLDKLTTINPQYVNAYVNVIKIGIDTNKWLAGMLLPKQYGKHPDDKKSTVDSLVERLMDKLG